MFLADGFDLVCTHLGVASPFDGRPPRLPAAGGDGPATIPAAPSPTCWTARSVAVAVADDTARRAALWRYREAHTEAIAPLAPRTSST